jgi:hypothetical protein
VTRQWARRLLAGSGSDARTLAGAGNAHTPVNPTELGVPMGARLAGQRPGVQEIRIGYGAGSFWSFRPRRFGRHADPYGTMRLRQHDRKLVLDLPLATEAVVPQRAASRTRRRHGQVP